MVKDKPNTSLQFTELFFSFESYMNDTISISVIQDHILNKKQAPVKNPDQEQTKEDVEKLKKEYVKPEFLPFRLVLGRKSLVGERNKTNPTSKKKVNANDQEHVQTGSILVNN